LRFCDYDKLAGFITVARNTFLFLEDRYIGGRLGVNVIPVLPGRASLCDLLCDILAEH